MGTAGAPAESCILFTAPHFFSPKRLTIVKAMPNHLFLLHGINHQGQLAVATTFV